MSATPALTTIPLHGQISDLLEIVERRMAELVALPEPDSADLRTDSAHAAAAYHLLSGGQRVRARLALGAGLALGLTPVDAVTIAACAELLHNASLIHDDLQDRDETRRGVKTVWAACGDNVAICAGDLLLSAAFCSLARFSDAAVIPHLLSLVHTRTAAAIHGQCADLATQSDSTKNIATYERIVVAKSGALLSLPLELALVGSGQTQWAGTARRAAEALAIGYQIVDDLDDFAKDTAHGPRSHSLNVCLMFNADHGGQAGDAENVSRDAARKLGQSHLLAAVALAETLPAETGALLVELASRLAGKL